MYKHILSPTDGSERSGKAVGQAIELAERIGARLTVLTVTRPLHALAGEPQMVVGMDDEAKAYVHRFMTADARERLEAAIDLAEEAGIAADTVSVEHEHIYQAIIDTADKRGCDLILMASHGRSGLSAVLLGSETVKVLTHSTIPVLVVR
jgi:nucleotide-binding universal stress UspA family protein